jgi:hypothetical protein
MKKSQIRKLPHLRKVPQCNKLEDVRFAEIFADHPPLCTGVEVSIEPPKILAEGIFIKKINPSGNLPY